MLELTTLTKILLVALWLGGSIAFYYYKYGKNGKIEIMSVASVERKYKKRNEESKKSIFN